MLAYHSDAKIKSEILTVLVEHRAADSLVQGYGYWADGKGCAVGCTIQSGDHLEYERRFGIPVMLAQLEDCIFEGLPVEAAREWPERFMGAIAPGADLSRVGWKFLLWLLTDETMNPGIRHPLVSDAVRQCADVISAMTKGLPAETSAARSAARSAESAARSTESAARSAARSAESAAASAAWSAESAAWSAACAARSAARSAESAACAARSTESAAWSAAYQAMADKLIALIEEPA